MKYNLLRIGLSVATTLCLAGCLNGTQSITAKQPGSESASYLDVNTVPWKQMLAAPPPIDSPQQELELHAVLDMQQKYASGARFNKAVADSEASCFRFADVLGPNFTRDDLPITAAFLDRAANSVNSITGLLKRYWQRPRPFVVSQQVHRLADIAPGSQPQPTDPITQRAFEYSSYPSGHATYGMACALLLTQLEPDDQPALFLRAVEYGESREIVGAHFPSDVLAGRIVATAAFAIMAQNTNFQRDLEAARREFDQVMKKPLPRVYHSWE